MSEKKYLLTHDEICQLDDIARSALAYEADENDEMVELKQREYSNMLEAHEYRERTALYEYRNHAWHCTSCGDVEPVGGAEYCPTCGAHIVGNRGGVL